MDPRKTPPDTPRNVAKAQYAAVRRSLTAFEERVVDRYWDENTPVRVSFGRLLGSLDRLAGWLFDDEEIAERGSALLRGEVPAAPARELERGKIVVAQPSGVQVTFTLPAEVNAGSVALCGEFNDWSTGDTQLERGSDGSWAVTIALEPGHSYRYRYLLDGERWENGQQADRYVPNPYGSLDSVIDVQ
jgi:hypothetical protein